MAGPVCGAQLSKRPGTCSKPAGWRTDHPGIGSCLFHGGKAPGHVKHAAKAMATQLMNAYGKPREISAGDWLLEELHHTAGTVHLLRELVSQLAVGELVWGDAEKIMREGGNDAALEITQRAGPNVWVQLLAAERKHGLELARSICSLDVDARRVRIEELKAAAVLLAFDALLDRLELTDSQRAVAALELPRVLVMAAERAEQPDAVG